MGFVWLALFTLVPQLLDLFTNDSLFYQLNEQIIYYIYYIPVHVSSNIVLIFKRTIILVQHLVSSHSLGDSSVHRLREDSRNLIT